MTPEMLARYFHIKYEELAPQYGYETRTDTKKFDPESPNGKLMVAVARAALYGPLALPARLAQADVIRGRICRAVCFGVNDDDLPAVLELCDELQSKAMEQADRELAEYLPPTHSESTRGEQSLKGVPPCQSPSPSPPESP